MPKLVVEEVVVSVALRDVLIDARAGWGDGRRAGYVTPRRGRALWLGYEVDLTERVLRLDGRLLNGAIVGTTVELLASRIATHTDRVRLFITCSGCGRATRELMIATAHAPAWACRRCLRLIHRSTRQRRPTRAAYDVQRARVSIGLPAGPITHGVGVRKPFRMHWRTWDAMQATAARNLAEYLASRRQRERPTTTSG